MTGLLWPVPFLGSSTDSRGQAAPGTGPVKFTLPWRVGEGTLQKVEVAT